MPLAPSADDLRELDLPIADADAPLLSESLGADADNEATGEADPKPGGLLMRYLQSEES